MTACSYEQLSLTARLAIALHCFGRYCKVNNIVHEEIELFLDDLWEFPIITNDRWDEWESHHPQLVDSALGNKFPSGLNSLLTSRLINEGEFRELIESTVEIIFSSFYGASDNNGSLAYLQKVIEIVDRCFVYPPPISAFTNSLFSDRSGWGKVLTIIERDDWRNFQY